MSTLTDEQIAEEDRFLAGLPRVNIGALLMPPVWGPVHGMWAAFLFYPAWLVADNVIYGAASEPSVLNVAFAVLTGAVVVACSVAFSIVSQPFAAHRAADQGVSREAYLRRQRVWAVVSAVLAVLVVGLATYYNLVIRPTVGQ